MRPALRQCDLVPPTAKDYNRTARRIGLALDQPPASGDGAIERILHTSADVLGITGSCWHHTDPGSGLPTGTSVLGEPPGSFEQSLVCEFQRPDVNRFDELRARRSPVSAISTETGGKRRTSARFREMIEPAGSADEHDGPLTVLDGALRALGLSAREREVTTLLLRGHSAKAIAAKLTISPWTVQDHIKAIYDKTSAHSRPELVTLVPGTVATA